MRPEVVTAYIMGFGLPILETMRRRTNFSPLSAYVDDYIAGALLLGSAWAIRRGWPSGRALLVASWGIICGGFYYSFFGQIQHHGHADISGLSSASVAVVKGVLFAVSIACLLLAIRGAVLSRTGSRDTAG